MTIISVFNIVYFTLNILGVSNISPSFGVARSGVLVTVALPHASHHLVSSSVRDAEMESRSKPATASSVAAGKDWVSTGGCCHATALGCGLDAQLHATRRREFSRRVLESVVGAW